MRKIYKSYVFTPPRLLKSVKRNVKQKTAPNGCSFNISIIIPNVLYAALYRRATGR